MKAFWFLVLSLLDVLICTLRMFYYVVIVLTNDLPLQISGWFFSDCYFMNCVIILDFTAISREDVNKFWARPKILFFFSLSCNW